MSELLLVPRALADMDDIWLYIARDNMEAADRVIDNMRSRMSGLLRSPNSGRVRPELGEGIRSYPAGVYLIFYRTTSNGVVILRVMHGQRDLPSRFGAD